MSSHPARGAASKSEGWENFGFVALLAVLGAGLLLWAAGEVAGLIGSGQRPGVSFSKMGSVTVRIFQTPGDPAAAWPRNVRHVLPGPVLFYSVLVALAAVAGAVVTVVVRLFREVSLDPERATSWASARDLRALAVKHALPGRLVLGRVGRTLIAAEQRQSVIVLGPTQSMKTSGFAIPAILEWRGPVVATSVKTDLLRNTIAARHDDGNVWVYDPTSSTKARGSQWSPLEFCRDGMGRRRPRHGSRGPPRAGPVVCSKTSSGTRWQQNCWGR